MSQCLIKGECLRCGLTCPPIIVSSNSYVNFSGRAFPDVAAHSEKPDFLTIQYGTGYKILGTSEAAPLVAGIIALLNDARFRAGKPAMGFINPWLYHSASKALNDIVVGLSLGCTGFDIGSAKIPYASWNATIGW